MKKYEVYTASNLELIWTIAGDFLKVEQNGTVICKTNKGELPDIVAFIPAIFLVIEKTT